MPTVGVGNSGMLCLGNADSCCIPPLSAVYYSESYVYATSSTGTGDAQCASNRY